jgi:hypothetical protein
MIAALVLGAPACGLLEQLADPSAATPAGQGVPALAVDHNAAALLPESVVFSPRFAVLVNPPDPADAARLRAVGSHNRFRHAADMTAVRPNVAVAEACTVLSPEATVISALSASGFPSTLTVSPTKTGWRSRKSKWGIGRFDRLQRWLYANTSAATIV